MNQFHAHFGFNDIGADIKTEPGCEDLPLKDNGNYAYVSIVEQTAGGDVGTYVVQQAGVPPPSNGKSFCLAANVCVMTFASEYHLIYSTLSIVLMLLFRCPVQLSDLVYVEVKIEGITITLELTGVGYSQTGELEVTSLNDLWTINKVSHPPPFVSKLHTLFFSQLQPLTAEGQFEFSGSLSAAIELSGAASLSLGGSGTILIDPAADCGSQTSFFSNKVKILITVSYLYVHCFCFNYHSLRIPCL